MRAQVAGIPLGLSLGLLLLLNRVAPAAGESDGPSAASEKPAIACGAECLFSLLQIEGCPAPLNAVLARLPVSKDGSTSLLDLRETARALGLNLVGIRLPPGDTAPQQPVLTHLRRDGNGHFVLIRPVGTTSRLVQVIDGTLPAAILDYETLSRSPEWTGLGLSRLRGRLMGLNGLVALSLIFVIVVFAVAFLPRPVMPRFGGRLRSRQAGGFTLIELLVSIGIISILIGLLLPAVQAAAGWHR